MVEPAFASLSVECEALTIWEWIRHRESNLENPRQAEIAKLVGS